MTEGLSVLIRSAVTQGHLHGCKVAHNAPILSHLLFDDDSLLLVRATDLEAAIIKKILKLYGDESGQLVHLHKSSILFSKNTSQEKCQEFCNILGIKEVDVCSKYLGLPLFIGRNKKDGFSIIKDKLRRRIHSWKNIFYLVSARKFFLKLLPKQFLIM